MSGRKVAPVLDALLDDLWIPSPKPSQAGDVQVLRLALKEFRALLAVARAAERERVEVLAVAREARNTHQGELDGDRIGRLLEDSDERMACALLRLRSQSKKGAGR